MKQTYTNILLFLLLGMPTHFGDLPLAVCRIDARVTATCNAKSSFGATRAVRVDTKSCQLITF